MELFFEEIKEQQLTEVLQLFKQAAERIAKMNIDHWQYWHQPPPEKIDWVKAGLKNGEYYFIKEETGRYLGMLRMLREDLLYWGVQQHPAIYIHSLVIKPEYNGQGLGEKVLQAVEKKAQQEGLMYVRLDADAKNPKLCAYYEAYGFAKVGQKKLPLSTYTLYEKEIN